LAEQSKTNIFISPVKQEILSPESIFFRYSRVENKKVLIALASGGTVGELLGLLFAPTKAVKQERELPMQKKIDQFNQRNIR
jgi:hypothetical protein